ncbi:MAG: type I-E CRISPR-associated endoribonuclease Cas2e [Peptoniphilaceae bacterium]|nr:type I-E CRISPR-associated endoribonuclease Cas2e [Peptoniphilaceae bacterium]MDY6019196.1 type I-E CRISPR-associated endoribonuclease Cas2e [Anaerococcus sp.]
MPLTVVTLTNVTNSLRGDLSKWMQEIASGVYVGNFNTKVREKLWNRIRENIGDGQATISYSYRNEIGYKFDTINTKRKAIDYDGLPLILIKEDQEKQEDQKYKLGFSKQAKLRNSHKYSGRKNSNLNTKYNQKSKPYVIIDIETDGLDYKKNKIIEIGAVKIEEDKINYFQSLVKTYKPIPKQIRELTKIDDTLIKNEGRDLENVMEEFIKFIEDAPIVAYNLDFDLKFINMALRQMGKSQIKNKKYDLLVYVKKEKKYLSSYKLSNILKQYQIEKDQPHRALEDAKLTYELSTKVGKFLEDLNKQ